MTVYNCTPSRIGIITLVLLYNRGMGCWEKTAPEKQTNARMSNAFFMTKPFKPGILYS
jgi:hypothetical protein